MQTNCLVILEMCFFDVWVYCWLKWLFCSFSAEKVVNCWATVVCLPVCSVCLSVTLVYCGQMVGWIKMKLATEVGLGPGHIVFDGDPAPPSTKGTQPPIFGPCLSWSNAWMDQGATWYGGRPRPRRQCVRWGPAPPLKRGAQHPQFWPMSVVAKVLDGSR